MTARPKAIVIGASSGAVEAVGTILAALPPDFSVPIVAVVHVPPDRPSALVDVFATRSTLPLCEAEDKTPLREAMVYVAPPDYHVMIEQNGSISLSSEEPVHYSRPSVDVLFETAADAFGEALVGIVLTGANADGASGLRRIADEGGVAIVQSPDEATAPLMPQSALEACPKALVMPLRQIADYLREVGRK